MPVTFTFRGDQVATTSAVDDLGGASKFTIGQTPFLSTDILRITFTDGSFAANGEFAPFGDIIYTAVEVERNGIVYQLGVDAGSKIKESGNGNNKEQGDSFFQTNDSIKPASSGPFSSIPEDQYVFVTTTTLTAGSDVVLSRESGSNPNSNFDTSSAQSNPFIFFAAGTLIETATGPRPIEELRAGEAVRTLDAGLSRLVWIGHSPFSQAELAATPKLRPVRIRAGALGPGVPQRDLLVSRQHRILVRSRIAERMFGKRDVLIPAIKLCGLAGVDLAEDVSEVTYCHLLFERHELVCSNGAWSESLLLGCEALKALGPENLAEIEQVFPRALDAPIAAQTARTSIAKKARIHRLLSRHCKHDRPLIERQSATDRLKEEV